MVISRPLDSSTTNITKEANLANLKQKNPENINSVRNKLEYLYLFLNGSVDILSIAETKIDESFPTNQFLLNSFKIPYRLDLSHQSGGILTYIRSDIPSRPLNSFKIDRDFQTMFIVYQPMM